VLEGAFVGRSHRSALAKARLVEVCERSRAILGIPADYRLGIVGGSDTGAFEAAMWSLLGPRGVDVVAFEAFGKGWLADLRDQLRLPDVRALEAPYGELPDLAAVDPARDTVFCWNGTTSGVRIPDASWIAAERAGLTLCDATSAAFAMELPWQKLDAVTWSWQKALGGEAQHGVLALSPRAVARLEAHVPAWPIPKLYRLASRGRFIQSIFDGETINTPSMLAVEDALDGLRWAEDAGGLPGLIARTEQNMAIIEAWVERTSWVDFLARDPAQRSTTSVCLRIVDPAFSRATDAAQRRFVAQMTTSLAEAGTAFDIAGYRDAPPGLRIWCGATVEASDLRTLLPWLDWAFVGAAGSLAGSAAAA
jgi:phosphoserine aminotransferase